MANTVAASPEMALAGMIGNTAKNCASGAVVGSTIVETVKSIGNNDNAETYVGNVVGKGAQAAFSAGGGAVAGELAGLGAIALGAGPVGWAVAAVGTGLLATGAISEATNDVAENIAYSVSDGVENLRLKSSLVDVPCTVAENVGLGLGLLWDNTIGSWFL